MVKNGLARKGLTESIHRSNGLTKYQSIRIISFVHILIFMLIGSTLCPVMTASEKVTSKSEKGLAIIEGTDHSDGKSIWAGSFGGFQEVRNNRGTVDGVFQLFTNGEIITFMEGQVIINVQLPAANPTSFENPKRPATFNGPMGVLQVQNDVVQIRSLEMRIIYDEARNVKPQGRECLPIQIKSFVGNNTNSWGPISNYAEIIYKNLYNGIDLIFKNGISGLKYEFVVHENANPDAIKIRIEGGKGLYVKNDELIISTPIGQISDSHLKSFYLDEQSREIKSSFKLLNNNTYGFSLNSYESYRTIIIDPFLYSSFLGGNSFDIANKIRTDNFGNIYIVGQTKSSNFPHTTLLNESLLLDSNDNIFITKFKSDGKSLIFSIIIGGSMDDKPNDLQIDQNGTIFIIGETKSLDFPITSGAFQSSCHGHVDSFVCELSSNGTELLYSTYFGGSGNDSAVYGYSNGEQILLTGYTDSSDLPITDNALQVGFGGVIDGFIAYLRFNDGQLVYCTFLGGSGADMIQSSTFSSNKGIFLTGVTTSSDLLTTNDAIKRYLDGPSEVFISRLSPDGRSLLYSTYLGGSLEDGALGIILDNHDRIIITGYTDSDDFPITAWAFQKTTSGFGYKAFVTALNPDMKGFNFSTYLSGQSSDNGISLIQDKMGSICVCGSTASEDFPITEEASQKRIGGNNDVFLARLSDNGSLLLFSTFIGGGDDEESTGIALGEGNDIWVCGITSSGDFPTSPDGYQIFFGGGQGDGFLSKVKVYYDHEVPIARINVSASEVDQHGRIFFDGLESTDNVGIVKWSWFFTYNGSQVKFTGVSMNFTFDFAGSYDIKLIVEDEEGNNGTSDAIITVRDITKPHAIAGPDWIINQHQVVIFDASGSTDNVAVVKWTWEYVWNDTTITLVGRTVNHAFDDAGKYKVRLNISDAEGNWAEDYLNVTVLDITNPIAEAGADQAVGQHQRVILNGSASTDNIGIINWSWSFIYAGAEKKIYNNKSSFIFDNVGTYEITLTVYDAMGNYASDITKVVVKDTTPPIPRLGENRTVAVGETVALDGSSSTDNVGIGTAKWLVEFNGKVSELDGISTVYTFQKPGSYQITLRLVDQAGNSADANITIMAIKHQESRSEMPFSIYIAVIVGVSVIIGIWAFNHGRKKRKEKQE